MLFTKMPLSIATMDIGKVIINIPAALPAGEYVACVLVAIEVTAQDFPGHVVLFRVVEGDFIGRLFLVGFRLANPLVDSLSVDLPYRIGLTVCHDANGIARNRAATMCIDDGGGHG